VKQHPAAANQSANPTPVLRGESLKTRHAPLDTLTSIHQILLFSQLTAHAPELFHKRSARGASRHVLATTVGDNRSDPSRHCPLLAPTTIALLSGLRELTLKRRQRACVRGHLLKLRRRQIGW
jgi:hypothetical protein